MSKKSFQRQLKNMNKAAEYQRTHVKIGKKKHKPYVWVDKIETVGTRYALDYLTHQANGFIMNRIYSQIKEK